MIVSALLVSLSSISALPGGAPFCQINAAQIQGAHGAPNNNLGYSIATQKNGNAFTFRVTNSAGRNDFNGILMYVLEPTVLNWGLS